MSALLEQNFISTKDASELSGYNPDYLARLCREKKIDSTRVGRAWLVSKSSLQAFMRTQEQLKRTRAEELSRTREEEYRVLHEPTHRVTRVASPYVKEALGSVPQRMNTVHAFLASPRLHASGPMLALALTLATLAGSLYAAETGFTDSVLRVASVYGIHAHENLLAVLVTADEFNDVALARSATRTVHVEDVATPVFTDAVDAFAANIEAQGTGARTLALAYETKRDEVRVAMLDASDTFAFADVALEVRKVASHPEETMLAIARAAARSYESSGERIVRANAALLDGYAHALERIGEGGLAFGSSVRDTVAQAPHAFFAQSVLLGTVIEHATNATLATYTSGIDVWTRKTPEVPARIIASLDRIGGVVGGGTVLAIQAAPSAYDFAVSEWSLGSARLAEGLFAGQIALGTVLNEGVVEAQRGELALLESTGEGILGVSRTVANEGELALSQTAGALAALPGEGIDLALGTAGKTAEGANSFPSAVSDTLTEVAASASTLPASILSAIPDAWIAASEEVALATYEAIHGIIHDVGTSLATLFVGPHLAVVELPTDSIPRPAGDAPTPTASSNDTTDASPATIVGGNTTVIKNIYETNLLTGASTDYVNRAIDSAVSFLSDRISNSGGSSSSGGGFSGGSLVADDITGTELTITGDGAFDGTVTGSNFVATSIVATSTLPLLSTNSFALGSDYITDLTGSGLLVTNGMLGLDATGDWTGTFDGHEGTYYLDRANQTGTQLASTISDFNTAVGSYVSATPAIPHVAGSAYGDILAWTGSAWGVRGTSTLNVALSDTTGTLAIARGGTGTTTLSVGQLLYGGSGGIYQSVATTSVSCAGTLTCTPFNVLGASPITITASGGQQTVSTSTNEIAGNLAYWTSTSGSPALLGQVATTSFAVGSEFSYTGTLGALIGGANGTLSLANNGVSLGKLVTIAANSILGNSTGSTGNVTAIATSSLGIALSDTTGTLSVARGGTGQATFTSGQLLYGNGTANLSSVGTSTLAVGTGLTSSGTLGYQIGGTNSSISFAAIAANSLWANATGGSAVPTVIATSSLFTWSGTGDVVRATSPTLVTPVLGAATYTTLNGGSITDSALTSGRVTYAGTGGLLQDSANLTFNGTTLTTNALAVTNGTTLSGALTYGGVTLSNSVTGTGSMVLSTSPSLTTPTLGVAAGTSLALGGATIGTDALAVTGTATIGGATAISGTLTTPIVRGGTAVGSTLQLRGTSNASPTLGTAGIIFDYGASGTTETGRIDSSSGFWGIGTTSPAKLLSLGGNVIIGAATAGGSNGTLTYGGVTLANSVTGTGSMVLSASPTFTGTVTTAGVSATSLTDSGLTSGRVTYATTAGLLTDSANLTFNGTTLTANALTVTNGTTLSGALTYGGVTLSNSVTGTGSMVLSTSPTFTTPTLGVAVGTSLALNGATIGTNALAVTGTVNISGATTIGGAITYGGVTLANSVTGTGSMVLSASPTFTGTLTTPALTLSGFTQGSGLFVGASGVVSQDNSGFFYDATNHRLGLGSTTPLAKLSIKGAGSTTGFNFQTTNSSDVPLFTILDSGKVGVGTTTPVGLLSVSTATNQTSAFTVHNSIGSTTLAVDTVDNNSAILTVATSSGATYFLVGAGGNIGIGTSTPMARLSVSNLGGGLQYLNFGNSVAGGFSNNSGTSLEISDNFGTNPTGLFVNDSGIFTIQKKNDLGNAFSYSGGYVGVGTTSALARLDVAGANNGSLPLFQLSSVSSFATTTRLIVTNAGSLGVGTTTPAKLFSVGGDMIVGAPTAGGSNGTLTVAGLGTPAGTFLAVDASGRLIATSTPATIGTGSIGQVAYVSATNLAIGTSTIFISTNQNVGISTTTPAALASIGGNLYIGASTAGGTNGMLGVGIAVPAYPVDVAGFINTNQFGGYRIAGNLLAYASSTNFATVFGLGAGGQTATTSATAYNITAVGYQALRAQTTGAANSALGYQSLFTNTTGFWNSAMGYQSLYTNSTGQQNNAIGYQALYTNNSNYNGALGQQALYSNSTGTGNNGMGYQALYSNSTGSYNSALGMFSLYANTGNYNVGIGYQVGYTATNGDQNVAIGLQALYANTSSYNTAVGASSMFNHSSGQQNTALGLQSMYNSSTGSFNTGLGTQALYSNGAASYSTGVGYQAGYGNSGSYNVAVGTQSLYNSSGANNNALGYRALFTNTTGVGNSAFGYQALYSDSTSDYNAGFGFQAGYGVTGTRNTIIGPATIATSYNQITTGSKNIAIGNDVAVPSATADNQLVIGNFIYGTGLSGTGATLSPGKIGLGNIAPAYALDVTGQINSTAGYLINGSSFFYSSSTNNGASLGVNAGRTIATAATVLNNTAIGGNALTSLSLTGGNNTGIGANALTANTSGADNTALGTNAIGTTTSGTGNGNTAVGSSAGFNIASGASNSYLGYFAGANASSTSYNTALGYQALTSDSNLGGAGTGGNTALGYRALFANKSGYYNNALGYGALVANTTGIGNVANGVNTLFTSTTGSYNTIEGYQAGYGITTGSQNIYLGSYQTTANANITSGSNNIVIGNDIQAPLATGSNQLNIGNMIFGTGLSGTGTTVAGNIGIGSTSPTNTLSVTGTLAIDSGSNVLKYFSGGAGLGYFGLTSNSDLAILTNGGEHLRIAAGGNVAVGSTTPAKFFSVGGDVLIGAPTAGGTNGTLTVANLAAAAGTFLAADPSGKIIATTTPGAPAGAAGQFPFYNAAGSTLSATYYAYASSTNQVTILGAKAGGTAATTTASALYLTAVGYQALSSNTSGTSLAAFGSGALFSNSNGTNNTGVGDQALYTNSSGNYNTAVGASALYTPSGNSYNTAIGYQALYGAGGDSNIAVGYQALKSGTGHDNIAIGVNALTHSGSSFNNTALGSNTLATNNTGLRNTALGSESMYLNSTGSENVALGYYALRAGTGSNNIALGTSAGEALTSGSNNIAIGYNIDLPTDAGSNQLTIGNLIFGTGIDGQNKTISSGKIGIGTTTPVSTFSVAGSTFLNASNGNNFITLDGSARGDDANIITWAGGDGTFTIDAGVSNNRKFGINYVDGGSRKFGVVGQIFNGLMFYSGVDLNEVARFDMNNGYFGIGTTTPGAKLDVYNGALCVDDSSPTCQNASRTAGTIYAVATAITGIDLAERYPTKDTSLAKGEIVTLDPANPVFVSRASAGASFLGVVSTKPGIELGGYNDVLYRNEKNVPLALAGRVPVKVNMEGGTIAPGDPITISSKAGVGKKATESGQTIGIALEPASSSGSIQVFIKPEYTFIPNNNLAVGAASSTPATAISATTFTASGDASIAGKLTVSQSGAFTGSLSAGAFVAPASEASGMSYTLGTTTVAVSLPSTVLTDGGNVNITKLATLALAGVQALSARTDLIIARLDSLEARLTALEDGSIATGTDVFSTTTLKNALASFGIDIQNGIAQFQTLVFRQLAVSKDSDGASSAGNETILAGNTVLEVENAFVLPTSKIFITFTSPVQGSWYLSNKEEGKFRVTLASQQDDDVSFDYFILQTEGQIATPTGATPPPAPPAPPPSSSPGGGSGGSGGNGTTTPPTSGDTTAPTITLNGEAASDITQGSTWSDPGATATDDIDGDLTSSITVNGSVDTNTPGLYTVSYSVNDAAGNEAHVSRVVTVAAAPTAPPPDTGGGSEPTP